jgi:hypothetical protein
MTYYSRPNLAIRAASERLGVAEVLRIGIQIGSAVETAHRVGILHRDIKPANLLINQYGVPGLTDFGIAGTIADSEADADEDTGVSIPWAAPEVLYATAPTSVRSDVYSLAATLWHLLVGRSPFEIRGGDNSAFEMMRRVRDTPPPSTGRADVPASLDRLLRQAMAKQPNGRPGSAIDFARGLQAVEQELQLARTELVVLTERLDQVSQPQAPPTVARPMSFRAQPTPYQPPARVPGGPPSFDSPAGRAYDQPPVNTSDPATPWVPAGSGGAVVRDRPGSDGGDGGDNRPRGRAIGLTIGAVLVVAAVVIGAFAAFSSGSGTPSPPVKTVGDAPGTQDAGQPGENIPLGKVTVVGKRYAKGLLVFTWTYSGAQPSDTFQVRASTGVIRAVTKPRVTYRSSNRLCVQVRVLRASGGDASLTFSAKGCA